MIFVDEARFSPAGLETRGHCCHEEIGLRESTNRVQWNYVPSDADKGQGLISMGRIPKSPLLSSPLVEIANLRYNGIDMRACVQESAPSRIQMRP